MLPLQAICRTMSSSNCHRPQRPSPSSLAVLRRRRRSRRSGGWRTGAMRTMTTLMRLACRRSLGASLFQFPQPPQPPPPLAPPDLRWRRTTPWSDELEPPLPPLPRRRGTRRRSRWSRISREEERKGRRSRERILLAGDSRCRSRSGSSGVVGDRKEGEVGRRRRRLGKEGKMGWMEARHRCRRRGRRGDTPEGGGARRRGGMERGIRRSPAMIWEWRPWMMRG